MDVAEFDLDRSVLRAWSSFRRRLADVLEGLGEQDVLYLEAPTSAGEEGSPPFVEGVANGEALHLELSGDTVVDTRSHLSESMIAELVRVGWQAPEEDADSPNFLAEAGRTECDRLAAMVSTAFRDVWGVPHPTFLEAGPFNDALGITRDPPTAQADTGLYRTTDRAEIQRLLDQTLTDYLGQAPHKDGDGDIPIRSGSALVFIRVLEDYPLVELKSPLVVDISGRTRAAEVVADLNANWRQVKFVLIRDVVVVLLEVSTSPFVPQQLIESLRFISQLADELDNELADRLNGRLPFEEPSQPAKAPIRAEGDISEQLPPELASLLQLAGPFSTLSPAESARICGDDRDTILVMLRIASEQEGLWRRLGDEARVAGSSDEALECDRESELWQDAVERLRAALREVVTRPAS